MKNKVQLYVGYVGISRDGDRMYIDRTAYDASGTMYFMAQGHHAQFWEPNGSYGDRMPDHRLDIVGPWVEEPAVNYNDGDWHRWAGGDRPVHRKSTVEIITPKVGSSPQRHQASKFTWDHELDPILAFRVINEFIELKEPREFWILPIDTCAGKIQNYDPSNHKFIHVKEVI
jgi:hypothetical protein